MPLHARDIHIDPLPYQLRLGVREPGDIDLVVIHCTELPDLATARAYGERVLYPGSRTGDSGHFYIDRDGSTYRWVDIDRVAHHTRGYNSRSLGIELVNTGRYPHWLDSRHQAMDEPYAAAQIDAFAALLDRLQAQLPNLAYIAGHEDLDITEVAAEDNPSLAVRRKRDPGPLFPWARILATSSLKRLS